MSLEDLSPFSSGEECVHSSPNLYEHSRWLVDAGQSLLRIDRYLANRLENTSRAFIQKALAQGLVYVNGAPVKSSYRVKPQEQIVIYQLTEPQSFELLPEDIPIDICYEDDDLLIVNKPAGMVVHPGHGHSSGTLVNALLHHIPAFRKSEDRLRPGLLHRLDKDTSGLLAVAKSDVAMERLSRQFLRKETTRQYLALAWGVFQASEGTIEGCVGRDPADRTRMRLFADGSQGKPAVTHWKRVEDFRFVTLLRCQLETGRMHQIRVHMASQRHPLFADARYGGDKILWGVNDSRYRAFVHKCFQTCPRQALHAQTLGLAHPITQEWMEFSTPPPADFTQLLELWRDSLATFQSSSSPSAI